MPKALSDLDRRTKWMQMGMTPAFIVHLNEVRKWDEFKELYQQVWRDQGGIRGPSTQREVAERIWLSMGPKVPLPEGVVPFTGAPPPTMNKGSAPEIYPDVPDDPQAESIYEIENDVDFWACYQWACSRCMIEPKHIKRWRSQIARDYHRKVRDPVESLKLMDIFKAKIAGQQIADRGGKIDDGTTELDLAKEVLASLEQ